MKAIGYYQAAPGIDAFQSLSGRHSEELCSSALYKNLLFVRIFRYIFVVKMRCIINTNMVYALSFDVRISSVYRSCFFGRVRRQKIFI